MQLLDESRSRLLERGAWAGLAALGLYEALTAQFVAAEVTALALLVCAAALLPGLLWVRRKVPGYPLFPMMAATYVWTYGLPALHQHSSIAAYPASRQAAALTAALLFLVVSTLTWLAVVRVPAHRPRQMLQFDRRATAPTLLAGLAGATFWQLNVSLQTVTVPHSYASVVTALAIAAVSVASPCLAFLLGRGKLTRRAAALYLALMAVYLVAQLTTLYLSGVVTTAVSLLAYSIARGRVPFTLALGLVLLISVLHMGKGEMRARYWGRQQEPVKPWDYPAFFQEWASAGLRNVVNPRAASGGGAVQSPLERTSLLWVMLRLQGEVPAHKPFLLGETYEYILPLLVPRFLNESKMVALRGNQVLAVHLGIVRKEDSERVAIGFGLLTEAYANFGWTGIVVLAVILGALLGQLTRWGQGAPVISFRGAFTMLVLVVCLQTENTAGGILSALFQQSLVLTALSCVLMRPLPPSSGDSGKDLRGRAPGAPRPVAAVPGGASPALP